MKLRSAIMAGGFLLSACTGGGQGGSVASRDVSVPTPPKNSLEAGLRMQMDQAEKTFANSTIILKDPELHDYVKGVTCKLAPNVCPDIRLYIVKLPYFNASMAPNGAMQVWTGLLLRVDNEAQLATVLGHEMGHYIGHHAERMWTTTLYTSNFIAFFAGVGNGAGGLVGTIGALGGLSGYSRNLETEADEAGQDLLYAAGYDPAEAAKLWTKVKEEADAGDQEEKSIFLATHPTPEDRLQHLRDRAATYPPRAKPVVALQEPDRLAMLVQTRWRGWLESMIDTGEYEQSLYLINNLERRGFSKAVLDLYRGDIYRRRSAEGDLDKAKAAYLKALSFPDAPAKIYKNLGLVAKRQKETASAIGYFESYLDHAPDAKDRFLVQSYIKQLRQL